MYNPKNKKKKQNQKEITQILQLDSPSNKEVPFNFSKITPKIIIEKKLETTTNLKENELYEQHINIIIQR